ncbi:hypothetical protein, partial [Escherichia coli]|uniref:hypothetical protein n=1 Tax=Escherichia coli TaxID=562 RepID=UPI003EE4BB87
RTSGEKRVFLVILFTSFSGSLVSRISGAVQAVYDYVTGHKGVCALEHDGFVSYEEVTDWSHPYLLIEKKH